MTSKMRCIRSLDLEERSAGHNRHKMANVIVLD